MQCMAVPHYLLPWWQHLRSGFQPHAVTPVVRLFSAEYMQWTHHRWADPSMWCTASTSVLLPRWFLMQTVRREARAPPRRAVSCRLQLAWRDPSCARRALPATCLRSARRERSAHALLSLWVMHVHAKSLGVLKRLHEAAHQHGRSSALQWHRCPCFLPSIGFTSHGAPYSDTPTLLCA